jgi:hypothetical protein
MQSILTGISASTTGSRNMTVRLQWNESTPRTHFRKRRLYRFSHGSMNVPDGLAPTVPAKPRPMRLDEDYIVPEVTQHRIALRLAIRFADEEACYTLRVFSGGP